MRAIYTSLPGYGTFFVRAIGTGFIPGKPFHSYNCQFGDWVAFYEPQDCPAEISAVLEPISTKMLDWIKSVAAFCRAEFSIRETGDLSVWWETRDYHTFIVRLEDDFSLSCERDDGTNYRLPLDVSMAATLLQIEKYCE